MDFKTTYASIKKGGVFFEKEIIPFSKVIQISIIGDEATCAGRWKYAAIDKFVLIDQEYYRGMQLSVENWKL